MPSKEWSDDEVKAEIAAAIAIVREDRFEAFVRNKVGQTNDNPPGGDGKPGDNGNGGGNPDPASKKSRSLWWGDPE